MKTSTFLFLFSLLLVSTAFSQNIKIEKLHSNVFNNTRNIRVYLPPDYYKSGKNYPVLYMNDGIGTFAAYGIPGVVDSLINNHIIDPIIIVGIDNGASVEGSKNPLRDRANEYLPWPDASETNDLYKIKAPEGSKYPSFLFTEVMPMINKKYHTKTDKLNTGLGGASYGALISLYTLIHNPGRIGFLLLESPSLYVDDRHVMKELKITPSFPKTYIGIGTKEGSTDSNQNEALDDAVELGKKLTAHYGAKQILLKIDTGGSHNYDFFAKRFPTALHYLYGIK